MIAAYLEQHSKVTRVEVTDLHYSKLLKLRSPFGELITGERVIRFAIKGDEYTARRFLSALKSIKLTDSDWACESIDTLIYSSALKPSAIANKYIK